MNHGSLTSHFHRLLSLGTSKQLWDGHYYHIYNGPTVWWWMGPASYAHHIRFEQGGGWTSGPRGAKGEEIPVRTLLTPADRVAHVQRKACAGLPGLLLKG